jgi:hypothetical protein
MHNCIDLNPANPNYSPMHIESAYASDPSWFRIIGKVVATVKRDSLKERSSPCRCGGFVLSHGDWKKSEGSDLHN